nr:AMP-binding protein [Geobacillus sp. FJAT-46040]
MRKTKGVSFSFFLCRKKRNAGQKSEYINNGGIAFWSIDRDPPPFAKSAHEQAERAREEAPSVRVEEGDLYAIMYTSGTTGRPKGVMHRHRDMIEQSVLCHGVMRIRETDRGLAAAPLFHCAELHCCLLPRVHAGAASVILHHFDARLVLETIERERITVLFGAPTMWNMILQENVSDYDLSSLRLGLYGAAPMAPALVRQFQERLGIGLVQAYGMTEMGPAVTFLLEDEQLKKPGSAGRACLNHEIRVVRAREDGPSDPDEVLPPYEVGEIVMRGPCMMAGYYKREEATEKALYKGWYHSDDLGYLDEDGYLYVADRVDDMVISGGENVYPREVEDVLYEHPKVLDAAVLGEPDEAKALFADSRLRHLVRLQPGGAWTAAHGPDGQWGGGEPPKVNEHVHLVKGEE